LGFSGGAERDRTAGLLVANEALSQLSYSPTIPLSYQHFGRCALPAIDRRQYTRRVAGRRAL
jgi:hypothetical protein